MAHEQNQSDDRENDGEWLPVGFHPRVFSALGSDLVTNDLVAITELVKNAYDAFATRVDVRFGSDKNGDYLEIQDNGHGMDRETIENVWCVVATPHRKVKPTTKKGNKRRRVSGEKGLGRLSTARLGERLEVVTQSIDDVCWKVTAKWNEISKASDLSECGFRISKFPDDSLFEISGTRIRIYTLRADWTDDLLDELSEHLARLISPFRKVEDFSIFLTLPGGNVEPTEIVAHDFLKHPKYELRGFVSESGKLECNYAYTPIGAKKVRRRATTTISWEKIRNDNPARKQIKKLKVPGCGEFSFEIRAWDIDRDSVEDISENYKLSKSLVRSSIPAHKGISVYRDNILVLPKSESSRDWLGLDVRRVSRIGARLSTTQIVGYVAITGDENENISDTSDRERLVDQPAVHVFEHLLRTAVSVLENERQKDRLERTVAEKPLKDLFGGLSGDQLVEDVAEVADSGATADKAVPIVAKFNRDLAKTKEEIERRFVYYSRLATIGTIAEALVHEVGNKVTTIDSFVRAALAFAENYEIPVALQQKLQRADDATSAPDRLSKTFSPLANQAFRRGRRSCDLTERVSKVLALKRADLDKLNVRLLQPKSEYAVKVDPGEVDAILLIFVDNAIYWMGRAEENEHQLSVRMSKIANGARVRVSVDDSGLGVTEDDEERIFYPGITNKPNGIGMGLTVASELVSAYGGQMRLAQPGRLGGATFEFDLPAN